jgi:hypothetical protein
MAAKKTPAKKTSPTKSRGRSPSSKSSFILSHPLDAAASAVVEAGKTAGHVFSSEYVHQVRSAAKRAGKAIKNAGAANGPIAKAGGAVKKAARAVRRRPAEVETASDALMAGGSLEAQFAALAVELGISRAEAILRRVREILAKLTF